MEKRRIFIVDDHALFRSGLKHILEATGEYKVTAEASNGAEFLARLEDHKPDLVILDINMPVLNGIEASKIALEKDPGLPILILSMYGDAENYATLLNLGVRGFVLKEADNEEFLTAIRKISEGGNYFSQELLLRIIRKETPQTHVNLSDREKEVLVLISKGLSTREIASILNISQRTVERHRTTLLDKTETRNAVSLVIFAIKNNLISV
jgi:DNA-binding NarL/FixJ family response regulator